jgi:hypothetical protein
MAGGGTAKSMPSGIAIEGGGGGTRHILTFECLCLRLDFLFELVAAWVCALGASVDAIDSEKIANKAIARVSVGRLTIIMSQ